MIYLKLLLTALFWGGTFVAGRILRENVGPFSAAFLRFAVASILPWRLSGKTRGAFRGSNGHNGCPWLFWA
jgi:drug/metabolite transporter (DMT)-like permease